MRNPSDFFDVVVIIPLEEELREFLEVFPCIDDRSTDTSFQCEVDTGVDGVKCLVIQQDEQGKTPAIKSSYYAINNFDIGLIVCLGIAGALSDDLSLGDVCYSGEICDITDNSKASDKDSGVDLSLSPTYFKTPREIEAPINFVRVAPDLKSSYENWRRERGEKARSLVSRPVPGRNGKTESLGEPKSLNGTIVCGMVTKSQNFNEKKLKALDRKMLAIETESGGIFAVAEDARVPCLTIRGISDHGDANKSALEDLSGGTVRQLAAGNAATFLRLQLGNPRFRRFLNQRREQLQGLTPASAVDVPQVDRLGEMVTALGKEIDAKLLELAPEMRLQLKGYHLPVPRIREVDPTLRGDAKPSPVELRTALQRHNLIMASVPRNYPDSSLPWAFADDLLTTEIAGKQVLPLVIEGERLHPPRTGFEHLRPELRSSKDGIPAGALPVLIIDGLPFGSPTRMAFILEQTKLFPDVKIVFLSQKTADMLGTSEFVSKTGAQVFDVCDASFVEIAHFIQKKFSMSGSESEVAALRLRRTFHDFKLSAHPSYFAGIPRETIAALLKANRRAELIQLAVDGFLSFLRASDESRIILSRTTRAAFLQRLATEINVHKRTFDEEALLSFTRDFAAKYDYNIKALDFVQLFVEKGILRFEEGITKFSIPFIEHYLLAKELVSNEALALSYFNTMDSAFDLATFDLYAELGPSPQVIDHVLSSLRKELERLRPEPSQTNVLLTDQIKPTFLTHRSRLGAFQKRLTKLAEDIQHDRGDPDQKQQILDLADSVREKASEESASASDTNGSGDQSPSEIQEIATAWAIGVVLLGSGSERLTAETKQELSKLIIDCAAQLLDTWTRRRLKVDFKKLKERFLEPDMVDAFCKVRKGLDQKEAKSIISSVIDILEFAWLLQPLLEVTERMCEQAHDRVLASSVDKAQTGGLMEDLLKGLWLAEQDTPKGVPILVRAIKALPPAFLLKVGIAQHLLVRTYWNHWDKADRLALLDAAGEVLSSAQLTFNKTAMQRVIKKEDMPTDQPTESDLE